MANKAVDKKKTMDVAKPGESAPDTSARPVIVTHRPMVQDPMMKGEPTEEGTAKETIKKVEQTHSDKVISPINEPEEKPTAPTEDSKEDTKDAQQKEEATEAATVDAVADQVEQKGKRKDGDLSPAEKAKQEALQKLITDKKYFVPIGKATRRRKSRRAVVLFLIFLAFLAGGYAMIDAGVVSVGIDMPIDLIKN